MTAKLVIFLIRAYQVVLSPVVGGACRFQPSCSAYAVEAVGTHGAWRGSPWPITITERPRNRPMPPTIAASSAK